MNIRIEGKELERVFANLEKQVRFAASKALTRTAQAALAEVIAGSIV